MTTLKLHDIRNESAKGLNMTMAQFESCLVRTAIREGYTLKSEGALNTLRAGGNPVAVFKIEGDAIVASWWDSDHKLAICNLTDF